MSNKVTIMAPKTPVTEGSHGIAAADLPNICYLPSPVGPVPSPLPNIAKSSDSPTDYSTDVKFEGAAVCIAGSSFGKSMGDTPSSAAGGGVISANFEGPAKFAGPACMSVQVEGKGVHLVGDPMLNNCAPGPGTPNAATMAGVIQPMGGPLTINEGSDEETPNWVEVQYLYADGTGVPGAEAVIMHNSSEVARAAIDDNGWARVDLEPDQREVSVYFEKDPENVEILREPTRNPDLDLNESDYGVIWGALLGDFNENPTVAQTVLNTAISMIPLVDQALDARDLTAAFYKMIRLERYDDEWEWLGVALLLVGFIPGIGSLIKGVFKLFFDALKKNRVVKWLEVMDAFNSVSKGHVVKKLKDIQSSFDTHKKFATKQFDDILNKLENTLESLKKLGGPIRKRVDVFLPGVQKLRKKAKDKLPKALKELSEKLDNLLKQTPDKNSAKCLSRNKDAPATVQQTRAEDGVDATPPAASKTEKKTGTKDPVDVASGMMFIEETDLELIGPIPYSWSRTYRTTQSEKKGALGWGWHHSLEITLKMSDEGASTLNLPDGRSIDFRPMHIGSSIFEAVERLRIIRLATDIYRIENLEGPHYLFEHVKLGAYNSISALSDHRVDFEVRFRYGLRGELTQVIESTGKKYNLDYDGGLLRRVYGPHPEEEGRTIDLLQYRYDQEGRLLEVVDAEKASARYQYLGRSGLLTRRVDRDGFEFNYAYEGKGSTARCIRGWGKDGYLAHSLDYIDEKRTIVTNSLGAKTLYEHNGDLVLREIELNAEGDAETTREWIYNEHRWLVEEIDALGRTTRYEHDDLGNVIQTTRSDGSVETYRFDEEGRLLETQTPGGARIRWSYDGVGHLLAEIGPDQGVTRFSYDERGLMTSQQTPSGRTTSYTWNNEGLLASSALDQTHRAQLRYDRLHRAVELTDGDGGTEKRGYDLCGRCIEIRNEDGPRIELTYNKEGQIIRWHEEGRDDIRLTYSGLGQLASRTVGPTTERYEYDTEGELKTIEEKTEGSKSERRTVFKRNARGHIKELSTWYGARISYEVDAEGSISTIIHPDGGQSHIDRDGMGNITAIHWADGTSETFELDTDGRVVKALNGSGAVELKRDVFGQVVRETQGDHWVEVRRDLDGFVTNDQTSLGLLTAYNRDNRGLLSSMRTLANHRVQAIDTTPQEFDFAAQWEHNNRGHETARVSFGVRSEYAISSDGSMSSIRVQHDNAGGQPRTILRRSINRSEYKESEREAAVRDALARLAVTEFGYMGTCLLSNGVAEMCLPYELTSLYRDQIRYDWRFGAPKTQQETTDAAGRRHVYTYDANGRVSKRETPSGIWNYRYSTSGQLTRVERGDGRVVELHYDPFGRCIRRREKQREVGFVWKGGEPIHSIERRRDEDGQWDQPRRTRTWLFHPDKLELLGKLEHDGEQTTTEKTRVAISDHNRLPTALIDREGEVRWSDGKWSMPKGCFTGVTQVRTQNGLKPIQDIEVGDKVVTHPHALEESSSQASTSRTRAPAWAMSTLVASSIAVAAAAAPPSEVPSSTISPIETHEPQSVVHLKLISDDHDNHKYELEVLKPTRWAEDLVSAGGTTRLSLDELEVEGWATISSYRPIETSETPHRLVIMKLSHSSNDVYEVSFVEGGAPLRGTGGHPLYSLDRHDWVRVRDLQVGERLQTAEGAVSVEALEKVRGLHRVYNLEVEGAHEYLVGEAGVRAHNTDCGNDKVYRALAEGEDPSKGLKARNPEANVSPLSHVAGKRDSQWISTTKDKSIAVDKYGLGGHGVVEIDLKKVNNRVEDVSGGFPGKGRLDAYAKKDKEVLIEKSIPAEAMKLVE